MVGRLGPKKKFRGVKKIIEGFGPKGSILGVFSSMLRWTKPRRFFDNRTENPRGFRQMTM